MAAFLVAFGSSCLDVSVEAPVLPQNVAVLRALEEWEHAGLPDVSGCLASSFVLPAQGPETFDRVCVAFKEEQGCVAPFNGIFLIVVAPGIPREDYYDPIAHEALHVMAACMRGRVPDPYDAQHRDARIWAAEAGL